ncbi:MAG: hypothetical protein M3Y56_00410 [Armatimonadota bacterium]|nr:hypothetical protein [Armatimonadota bacterium]
MLREDPQFIQLAGRLRSQVEHPLDVYEISAMIEAMGITDLIVEQDYGLPDVLSLAQRVEPLMRRRDVPAIAPDDDFADSNADDNSNIFKSSLRKFRVSRAYHWCRAFGKTHLIGFFFAMPIIVSIIGLLALRVSLWAALYNQPAEATAIGLGTVASFIVTGGYSQAIGRRGLFYRIQEEHYLTRTVCYYFIGAGFEMVLIAGFVGFVLLNVFGVLPVRLAIIAVTYYFFLSLLWLFLAVLYMLGQPLLFTPAIVVGIIVVHILGQWQPQLSLYVRQSMAMLLAGILSFMSGYAAFGKSGPRNAILIWSSVGAVVAMVLALFFLDGQNLIFIIGICVASLLAIFFILFLFARMQTRKQEETQTARLPRASLLWYKVGPYFAYGLLYYTFLFCDRLVAWSSPDRGSVYSGFLLRFRTGYEVGMDWGLILLIVTVGLTESQINSFALRIRDDEHRYAVADTERLTRHYRTFYASRALMFAIVSVVAILLLWFGINHIANFYQAESERLHKPYYELAIRAYLDPLVKRVFWCSSPGYAFLSWALFNNVFLFALSRPERVLRNTAVALVTNITVGYILTRLLGDHEWACIGFTVGSFVLAALSSVSVIRVINRLDYYYYSAFL